MAVLTDKQKEFRRETSRLISMANKRIKRLENSDFNTSPAYQKWVKDGAKPFSIRGLSQQEARNEYHRVNNYLNSATSSITGTKKVLSTMADNIGIEYNNLTELQTQASAFFELSNKVDEYLSVTNRGSEAIGYQRIWQAINMYVENNGVSLDKVNVNGLIDEVSNMAEEKMLQSNRNSHNSFFNTDWTNL